MWQIDNALTVVRALQPVTRQFGYHLAMGGGVLNKGESQKDLDLYFLPMGGFDEGKKHDPNAMFKHLERLWGESAQLASHVGDTGFYKFAIKFTRWGGQNRDIEQRIDCFIF